MSLLRLSGVVREIGTFVILDRIDVAISVGEQIGLVGPNGAGKTTLLRIAAGIDEPDAGEVQRRRGLSIGLLAQEAHFDAAVMTAPTLRHAVRRGAGELERLEVELGELERENQVTGHRYSEIQHRFESLGGYTLDQRVDETLSGLGFTVADRKRAPTSLSGGEQTRAALARLVIADPELLLLDEPTNHLDIDALEWLEEHLRRRHGALLVASHDRAFLDGTVTRIWELRDRRLVTFRGDYFAYHRQREERDVRAAKERDTHEGAIVREQELVQRYRSQRKFSKMHEHESRLERLQGERQDAPRRSRRLALPTSALAGGGAPSRSGQVVVELDELVVGYAPRLVHDVDGPERLGPREPVRVARVPWLAAQRGERIGIVGPNGAGKTTLLRTIAGDLPPLDGRLGLGLAVQIGYLAQAARHCDPGRDRRRRDHRGDADHIGRSPRLPRAVPVPRRRRAQGGPHALGRRAVTPRARPARDPAVEPAAPRRADEPPRHSCARGDRDVPPGDAGDGPRRQPRPATARDGLRPAVGRRRSPGSPLRRRMARLAGGPCRRLDACGGRRTGGPAIAPRGSGPTAGRRRSGPGCRRGLEGGARRSTGGGEAASGRRAVQPQVARSAAPPRLPAGAAASRARGPSRPRLSKDAYRRQKEAVDADLTRLGLRKSHLELALGDPGVAANFVELRRVTSELADVERALEAAEDAWLDLEERAP